MGESKKAPKIRFKGFNEDWEERKLKEEVITIGTGKSKFSTGNLQSDERPYAVLGSTSVISYDEEYDYSGDFILTARVGANAGDLYRYHGNAKITDNTVFLQGENLNYMYYALVNFDLKKLSFGTGQPLIKASELSNLDLLFPTLVKEKEKIGFICEEMDNLITLHQQMCEALKTLKKSMLQKMFPQKGKNVPEFRFAGFTAPWEQRKLEDVVEFLDTMRKPLEGAKRVSGPYPYYGASGIVDYVDGYIFDEELVLLSEDGANITDRNYPVCFLASGKYWVNNHAHVLRTNKDIDNNFLCMTLERKDYKQYNTGMAMPKLNQDICRRIPVLCCEYGEQIKIGNYFRGLDNLITLHQSKCEQFKLMKKYMLKNMFPAE